MPDKIYPLTVPAGIQKDGTQLSARPWIDGEWCRFYRGLPKKMGGYLQIIGGLPNVPRGTFVISNAGNFNTYLGDFQTLKYFTMNGDGLPLSGLVDRTPSGIVTNPYNEWTFDGMYSTVSNAGIIVAHIAPNLFSIDNTVEAPIYYGDAFSNTPLISTGISVSGGMVSLHPYLFMFGNDGNVMWSNANDPTTVMDSARVTDKKIVAGLATRGGNSSPAGLLWSLDALIRVTQVGNNQIAFAFDTVTSESSILSSKGIIEYDGIFFWAGVDRFLYYNGVVQELPNDMNLNFFFNNLNYAQRQKVWATKQTRWGEIWWLFPFGNSIECNHAIVYNVREKSWYNTPITRGSGYFEQTFAYPVWTDSVPDGGGNYNVWMHEQGSDQNIGGVLTAIPSYIKTPDLSWCLKGADGQMQGLDRWSDLYRVEPDFIQSGQMNLQVAGREYANSPEITFPLEPFLPTDVKIDIRKQQRFMTLTFSSDVIGGDYEMGTVLLVMRVGDARQ
jgi:hypothetical protein